MRSTCPSASAQAPNDPAWSARPHLVGVVEASPVSPGLAGMTRSSTGAPASDQAPASLRRRHRQPTVRRAHPARPERQAGILDARPIRRPADAGRAPTPTTSMIASIAPTSWNSSRPQPRCPWIAASTSARRSKTLLATLDEHPKRQIARACRRWRGPGRVRDGAGRFRRRVTWARVPRRPWDWTSSGASMLQPPTGSDARPLREIA